MGLVATAEGVEDIATLTMLRAHGCDEAQGFLIARPMEPESFPEWLMNFTSPGPAANEVHRRQNQIALVFDNQAVA
jgi:sensor c-di-GMP phosphodiesterase-like protein